MTSPRFRLVDLALVVAVAAFALQAAKTDSLGLLAFVLFLGATSVSTLAAWKARGPGRVPWLAFSLFAYLYLIFPLAFLVFVRPAWNIIGPASSLSPVDAAIVWTSGLLGGSFTAYAAARIVPRDGEG